MKKSLLVLFIALIVFAARGAEAAPKKVTLLLEGSDTSVPTSYNRLLSDGLRNAQVRFGPKKLSVSALNALSDADMLRPYMLRAASSDFVIIASAAYLKYFPEARAATPHRLADGLGTGVLGGGRELLGDDLGGQRGEGGQGVHGDSVL